MMSFCNWFMLLNCGICSSCFKSCFIPMKVIVLCPEFPINRIRGNFILFLWWTPCPCGFNRFQQFHTIYYNLLIQNENHQIDLRFPLKRFLVWKLFKIIKICELRWISRFLRLNWNVNKCFRINVNILFCVQHA